MNENPKPDHNDDKNDNPTELDRIIAEQDQRERDRDRLRLLDRIADRMHDVDLDKQQSIEWQTLPDGGEALLINGGGFDGDTGAFIANAGPDLHVVGSLDPLAPAIGCIVISPNGSRRLAGVVADPAASTGDEDEAPPVS